MLAASIISLVVVLLIPCLIQQPLLLEFATQDWDIYKTGLALSAIGGSIGFAWFLLNKRNYSFFTPFFKKFLNNYDDLNPGFHSVSNLFTTAKKNCFLLFSDLRFFSTENSINLPTSLVFENFGAHQVRQQFIFCYYFHQLRKFGFGSFFTPLNLFHKIFHNPQIFHRNSNFWLIFCLTITTVCIFLTGSCIYYNKIIFNFSIDLFLFSKTLKLTSWNITTTFTPGN